LDVFTAPATTPTYGSDGTVLSVSVESGRMTDPPALERARENATEIASTVVTGVWLAALFLDVEWWLPLMLFGYVVVVPVVSMLFDEEEELDGATERAPERDRTERDRTKRDTGRDPDSNRGQGSNRNRDPTAAGGNADAIDRLRSRYAEGDLTDEQFERKLDRLLETETPEDAAEWRKRERDGESERALERDRS
jgi:uncharacterized membrane protein